MAQVVIDFDTDEAQGQGGAPLAAGFRVAEGANAGNPTAGNQPWADDGVYLRFTGQNGPLMLFDSENPTGGDDDIGSPNEDCPGGGPGNGGGGAPGGPGPNCDPLGNVLIISQNGNSNEPNDSSAGGTFIFTFATPSTNGTPNPIGSGDASIGSLSTLDDVEGEYRTFDIDGNNLQTVPFDFQQENEFEDFNIGECVNRVEVDFDGSGAIPDIQFTPTLCVDLAIDKDDGRVFFVPGANNTYTLTVSNNGPRDVPAGTIITDMAPAGTTFVSTSGCTEDPNGEPTCTLPAIADGDSVVVQYTIFVPVNFAGNNADGDLINTATITPPGTVTDTDPTNNSDTDIDAPPIISVRKSVSDASGDGIVQPGEVLTYTIAITNNTDGQLNDIDVRDVLNDPAIVVDGGQDLQLNGFDDADPNNPDIDDLRNQSGGGNSDLDVDLAAGATGTITFTVTAAASFAVGDMSIDNTAEAITNNGIDNPGQGFDGCADLPANCQTSIPIEPQLDSVKSVADASGDGIAQASENLTYTINVTNSGGPVANDVSVLDLVNDAGVNVTGTGMVTITNASDIQPNDPANIGDLQAGITLDIAAGATATIEYTVPVVDAIADNDISIENVAVVTDENGMDVCGTTPSTDCETSIPTEPNISVAKTLTGGGPTAEAGEDLTYTITFTNTGGTAVSYAAGDIVETVPANTTAAGGDSFDCADGDAAGTLCENAAAFVVPASNGTTAGTIALTFVVTVDDPIPAGVTSIMNSVVVPNECPNDVTTPPQDNDCDEDTPTEPQLVAVKSVAEGNAPADGIAQAGEDLTYTISITNNGGAVADAVSVTDLVDDAGIDVTTGQALVIANASNVAPANPTIGDLQGGITLDIAAGDTATISYTVTVTDPIAANDVSIDNLVTVVDDGDPVCDNTGSDCDTTVPTDPNIRVAKTLTGGGPTAEAGEDLTYTITFTNTGGTAVSYAAGDIVETVPANTTAAGGDSFDCADGDAAGTLCENAAAFVVPASNGTTAGTIALTFVVTVDDPIPAGVTSIMNSVVVPNECPNDVTTPPQDNDCDEDTPTEPQLVAVKSVAEGNAPADGIAQAGEDLTYTISITNNGGAVADAVSVTDLVDDAGIDVTTGQALVIANASNVAPANPTIGDLQGGITLDIAAGDTATISYTVTVTDPIAANDVSIDNLVTVVDDGDPVCDNTGSDCDTTVPTDPNIRVAKTLTGGGPTAEAGEDLTYTITFTNTGGTAVSYAAGDIVETVPANTTAAGGDDFDCADGDAAGTLCENAAAFVVPASNGTSAGTIALTFVVTVDDPIPAGVTSIMNSVVVANECPVDGTAATSDNDCDEDTPTDPQLLATKSVADGNGDGIAQAGEVLTYTISIANSGGAVANDVSVMDAVNDPGITVNAGAALVINNASDVMPMGPTIGDLQTGITLDVAAGATATVSYAVTVTDPIAFNDISIDNLAVVEDENDMDVCGDTPGTDCETSTPTEGNIQVIKSLTGGGPNAEAGEDLTYTITFNNRGGSVFNYAIGDIDETVPANTTAAGSDDFDCADGDAAGTLCENAAAFVVPASNGTTAGTIALTFVVTVDDPIPAGVTSIMNSVVVPNECPNDVTTPPQDNDCDEDTPTDPQLLATKSVVDANGDGIAQAGEVLTYTISIANSGGAVANDVSVMDAVNDPGITVNAGAALVINNASDVMPMGPTIGDLQTGITLDVAAGATATVSYAVTVTDPIAFNDISIDNLAVVEDENDMDVCGDTPGTDCETSTPTEGNIQVIKSLTGGGPNAEAGEDLTYTITFNNRGGSVFNYAIGDIDETVPANTTAAGSDDFDCADGDAAGTLCENAAAFVVPASNGTTAGTIALTFVVTVDDPIPAGVTSIMNSVVVPNECPNDVTTPPQDNDCDEDTPTDPQLVAVKSVAEGNAPADGIAQAGEDLTYTISITNNGGAVADAVSVTDLVDDAGIDVTTGQALVIANASNVAPANPTIGDLQGGITLDIAAGDTATISYTVTVTDPIAANDVSIDNLVTVVDDGDPVCDNTGSDCDTTVPTDPNIRVAKTLTGGGPTAEAGEDLTYTITFTNTGGTAVNYAIGDIDETVPANTTAAGGDDFDCADGDAAGTLCENAAAFVVPASNGTSAGTIALTFVVTVDDPIPAGVTSIMNSVVVPNECPNDVTTPPQANDCDEDTPTEPQLVAVKSVAEGNAPADGIAQAGEDLTYTISITNNGGAVADAVSVTDLVDDAGIDVTTGQALVIANASNVAPANPTIGDLQGGITLDIAAGDTATISYTVTVTDPIAANDVSIDNLVTVVDDGDPVCDNTGSDCDTTVPTDPNIRVAKTLTGGGPTAEAGEDLTYTITFTNTGGTAVNYAIGDIDETVPANTTAAGGDDFDCADGDTGNCGNAAAFVVPASNGTSAGTIALTFVVTVDDPIPAGVTSIMNSVVVANECPVDGTAATSDNDCDEDTPTDPQLLATKSVADGNGDGIAQAGEVLTYTISIANSGGAVANDVSVMDAVNDPGITVNTGAALVINNASDVMPMGPTIGDLQTGITLDVAAGATATVSYAVTVTDPIAFNDISIDNLAVVEDENDMDVCGDTPGTDCETSTPTEGNIQVIKSLTGGGPTAEAGEDLTYTITFNNRGGSVFNYAIGDIDETVPANTTAAGGDDFDCADGDTGNCGNAAAFVVPASNGTSAGTIALTFVVTVDDPIPAGVTSIMNSVVVANECPVDGTAATSDNDCDEDTPTDPQLLATKSVADGNGDGIAQAGEVLTYTISIANSGGAVANDVSVMDAVNDPGITVNTGAALVINNASDVMPMGPTIGDLQTGITLDVAAGATATVSYAVTVTDPIAFNDISIDNLAVVEDENDMDVCGDTPGTDCETSTPTEGNIQVIKSLTGGGPTAEAGEDLTYTITFNNRGGSVFNYAIGDIDETVPANTTAAGGDDFDCADGDTGNCGNAAAFVVPASNGTSAGTIALTFVVTVDDPIPAGVTSIMNSVVVANECPVDGTAATSDNDCDEDTPTDPQLLATKSVADGNGDGIAQAGEVLTYTISIANSGGAVANDVSVMDAVNDPGITVNTGAALVINNASDVMPMGPTIGDLQTGITLDVAAGATATVSYAVTVTDPIAFNDISIDNLAVVEDENDMDVCGDTPGTDCETSTPTEGNIQVIKSLTGGGPTAEAGEDLTYTITFNNRGGSVFNYAIGDIDETVPANTTAAGGDDFDCADGDAAGTLCENAAAFVVPASNGTSAGTIALTFVVTVDDPIPAGVTSIMNSVVVANECPVDGTAATSDNDCDEDTPTDPQLLATKSVADGNGDGIAQAGEVLTYTISIANSGGAVANDVSVMDAVNDAGITVNAGAALVINNASDVMPMSPTIGDLQTGITLDVAAGATATVSYAVTVTDPIAFNDISIDNLAVVEDENDMDVCGDTPGTDCETSTPTEGNIQVIKSLTGGGPTAEAGEDLTYTITFNNRGGSVFNYAIGDIDETVPANTTAAGGDDFDCADGDAAGTLCENAAAFVVPASNGTSAGTIALTFVVTVDDPIPAGVTSIMNSVVVANECPVDGTAATSDNDCDEDTPTDPQLLATKSVADGNGDGIAQAGEVLTYTISIANSGGAVANDVSVMDAVNDAGITVNAGAALVINNASDVMPMGPTIGDLQTGITLDVAAGATATVSYAVTVTDPIAFNDISIDNLAVVEDENDMDVCGDTPGTDCETSTPTEGNIQVIKSLTGGGPTAEAGEDLTYTITFNNRGGSVFNYAIGDIDETVPANTTAAGGDDFDCADGDAAGTLCENAAAFVVPASNGTSAGTIALTFVVTVDDPIPAGVTSIMNSVVVANECPVDGTAATSDNDCDEDTPTDPQLLATKSVADGNGDGIAQAGEVLTYTISIANSGGAVANDVSVMDAVNDPGITVNTGAALVINNASDVMPMGPTIGDLQTGITLDVAAGATATVSYAVTVTDPIAFNDISIDNLAVVEDENDMDVCGDTPGTDCETSTPTEGNIQVIKSLTGGGPTAEAGEDLTYTITFNNRGGSVFNYAIGDIDETVPANTTAAGGDDFDCADGDTGNCGNAAAFVVPASNGTSAGTIALTFVVTVDDPIPAGVTSIMNSVVVANECPVDGTAATSDNDCDEDTPTDPQLLATKSVADGNGDGIAQAGEVLTYTISIANSGGAVANDVSVMDAVNDPGITVNTGAALVINNASDVMPMGPTIGDLQTGITLDVAAGATATVSYAVTVTDPIAFNDISIDNLAVVEDENDMDVCGDTPGTDCETSTPTEGNIQVIKSLTGGGPTAEAGEDLTYTITFNNRGGSVFNYAIGDIDETVPANTTAAGGDDFDCADGDAAGTLCENAAAFVVPASNGTSAGTIALTFVVTVDDPIPAGVTSIMNSVVVANECPVDGTAATSDNDCDEDTPTDPQLLATKSVADGNGDGIAQAGEVLTYTISIANSGGAVANDVSVMDAVNDPGITVNTGAALVINNASDVMPMGPTIGDLQTGITLDVAAGATATVSYAVTVTDPISFNDISIDNLAVVEDENDMDVCGDTPGTDCETSTPTEGNIQVIKSLTGGGPNAEAGEDLTYTITFNNRGGSVFNYAMGEIDETVPANTTAAGGDDFDCMDGDAAGTLCENAAAFVVPASNGTSAGTFSLTFVVTVDDPIPAGVTSIMNSVVVANECPVDGTAATSDNDCDEDTPTDPQLLATKSVADGNGDGIAQAGEVLTYTISIANSGGAVANDVSVMDAVNDPGITVNTGAALVINNASDVMPMGPTIGDLQTGITLDVAAGATATVSYAVTVTDPIAFNDISIDNLAVVEDENDMDVCGDTPGTDCETSTPTEGNIQVIKSLTGGGPTAEAGEDLTYTITFNNRGGSVFNYAIGDIDETVPANTTAAGGDDFDCADGDAAGTLCENAAAFVVPASNGTSAGTIALTFVVTVDDPIPAGVTSIMNSVVVANECPVDGTAATSDNDCDEDTPTDPQLLATKSVADGNGDGIAQAGEVLTYTISIANSGGAVANDVSVMDAVNDPGITVNTGAALVINNASDVMPMGPTIGDLQTGITLDVAAGATATVSYAVTVTDPIAFNDISIDNLAVVEDENDMDVCGDTPGTDCETSTPTEGNIQVIKSLTGGGPTAEAGEDLTYTITFNNRGGSVFNYAIGDIDETVPANTTAAGGDDFDCADGDTGNCGNAAAFVVPASNGTSAGTIALTFVVTVDDPIPAGVTSIMNSVVVANECPVDGTAATSDNDCDEDTPTDPQLLATKSVADGNGDGIAQAGEVLTYTISIANSGGAVANDVSVMDAVNDPGITVNTGAALVINNASDVMPMGPTIGDLQTGITLDVAAGATATVSYAVTVTDPIAFNDISIDNLAVVEDENDMDVCGDTPGTDCETSTPTEGNIQVIKSLTGGGPTAEAGEDLTYTITFNNRGGSVFNYAIGDIDETVPANTTAAGGDDFDCADGDTGNCGNAAAFVVPASNGTSAGTIALTFVVTVDDPIPAGVTSIMNSVVVANECPVDGTAATSDNDCDEDTPTDPQLLATKSVADGNGDGIAQAGEVLTYTISIANSGGAVANDVSVMDAVNDPGITVNTGAALVINNASDVMPMGPTIGDLQTGITLDVAAGATATVSYAVTVTDPIAFNDISIDNLAVVEDENDMDVCGDTPGTDCETSTPTEGNIQVIKSLTGGGPTAEAGEDLTYTITFNNRGGSVFNYAIGDIDETVPANTTAAGGDDFDCADGDAAGTLCENAAAFVVPASNGTSAGTIALTFVVTVDDPIPAGVTSIMNSVVVANECPVDGTAATSDNDCDEDTPTDPQLLATKSVADGNGDGIAQAGEVLTYTISIANSGGAVANDVSVMDAVNDPGITVNTGAALVINNASDVMPMGPTIGDLQTGITLDVAAGATATVSYAVTVTDPIAFNDISIDNLAVVEDENDMDVCGDTPGTDCETSTPTEGNIQVIKSLTGGGPTAEAGEDLTYTITFNNRGGSVFNYAIGDIDETVPANTTAAGGDDFDCADGDAAGTLCENAAAFVVPASNGTSAGTIALTFVVTVDDPIPAGVTSIMNSVVVANECPVDGTAATSDNDCDEDTPTDPQLLATKSVVDANGDGIAQAGEVLTYTISIANSGGAVANDVSVMDAVNDAGITVNAGAALVINNASDVMPMSPTIGDLQTGITLDVAAGATATVSYAVTVTDPISFNDISIDNLAVVEDENDMDVCGDTPGTDCETSTPTEGNIQVIKSLTGGGPNAEAGEDLTYTITFNNRGGSVFNYAMGEIDETVPANTTAAGGDDFDCMDGDAAGTLCENAAAFVVPASNGTSAGTFSLTFVVTVDDPIPAGVTSIMNSVVVPNECPVDGTAATSDNDCDEDTPTDPQLLATKSVVDANGDGIAQAGEVLTYTISIANSGGAVANDVSVMDAVNDAGITVNAGAALVINNASDVMPMSPTIGDLQTGITLDVAAGATATVSYAVTVTDPISFNDISIDNLAVVEDENDMDVCGDTPGTDCETSTPTEGNIQVIKSLTGGGPNAEAGEDLTYTITFNNRGGSVFNYAMGEIDETVPANTTAAGGDDFDCMDGDAAGTLCENAAAFVVPASNGTSAGTFSLTFVVTVDDPIPAGVTSIMNSVVVPNECPVDGTAATSDNDCDEDTPTDPQLLATKSVVDANGDGIAQAGEVLTYTISIANSGGAVANDVSVMDAVNDAGITVNAGAALVINNASDVMPMSPTIGDLQTGITLDVAAGATATVSYAVTVTDPIMPNDVSIDNIVVVTEEDGDEVCDNPASDCDTTVPTEGQIIVIKALSAETGMIDGQIEDGETVTYTISLMNVGAQPVSYMAGDIVETVPTGTTAVGGDDFDCMNGDPAGTQCFSNNGFSVPPSNGTNPGEVVLTFMVLVDDPLDMDIDNVINSVQVPNECNDPNPGDNDDGNICTVSTPTEPQLIPTKAVSDADGDGIAEDGEVLTYTISIFNAGTTTAQDALVRDPFSDPNVVINGAQVLMITGGNDIMPATPTINDLRTTGFSIDIAGGETVTVSFTVTAVDPIPEDVDFILNQATIDGNLPSCPDGTVFIGGLPDINGDGMITIADDANGDGFVSQLDCGPTVIPVLNANLNKVITSVNQISPTVFVVNYNMIIDNVGGVDIVYTLDDQLGYPSGPNQINLISGNASTLDGILEPGLAANNGNFTPQNNTSLQLSAMNVMLPAGQSDTYTVRIRVAVNPNTIGGSAICDGNPGSGFFNEAVIVGTVELDDNDCADIPGDRPAIDLDKSNLQLTDNDGDGFGDLGEIIQYTFVIENTGTLELSDVRLIDTRLQDRDGTFTTCDVAADIGPGEVMLTNPLAVGEIVTCLGEYTITQDDVDNRRVTNTALVVATGPDEQNVNSRSTAVFSNFNSGGGATVKPAKGG